MLAVSGFLEEDDIQNYGFDAFIDEPMGPDQLQEVVEVALTKDISNDNGNGNDSE